MPLQVWSGVAHVVASLPGPGRLDLFAVRPAGCAVPRLVVEAYDAASMVAAGEVHVWELNQALAALLADGTQARRLTLRDDGRGRGGHLDVVASGGGVQVVASGRGRREVAFAAASEAFGNDLNALVRHYLALARGTGAPRTIVLPEARGAAVPGIPAPRQPSARAALSRPKP